MTHSTGHAGRLNREGITGLAASFGSDPYSREELIAETGAAFLAAEAGIQTEETTEQNAAYLQSWIRALRGDPKLVVIAAAQAQKAVDHILGREVASNTTDATSNEG